MTPSKDDVSDPDFEAWKCCWEVNIRLQEKSNGIIICIVCGHVSRSLNSVYRPSFWRIATCWAGHSQAYHGQSQPREPGRGVQDEWLRSISLPGVCGRCDQNYILNLVNGEYPCNMEGCRRLVRFDEDEARTRLGDSSSLPEFTQLVRSRRKYQCLVHLEDVQHKSEAKNLTTGCNHDPNVCEECLRTDFTMKVGQNRLGDMRCPDPDCMETVPVGNVRRLLSDDIRRLYDERLALDALSKNPNFRWCKCGGGRIHDFGDAFPDWICGNCDRLNCFTCHEDVETNGVCTHLLAAAAAAAAVVRPGGHSDLGRRMDLQRRVAAATKAFEVRREAVEMTAATAALVRETSKVCPSKGCGARIHRLDGCSHMRCPRCSTDFCWSCKVRWTTAKPPPVASLTQPPPPPPGGRRRFGMFGGGGGAGAGEGRVVVGREGGGGGGGGGGSRLRTLHLDTCPVGVKTTVSLDKLDVEGYADGWNVDEGFDPSKDGKQWLADTQR